MRLLLRIALPFNGFFHSRNRLVGKDRLDCELTGCNAVLLNSRELFRSRMRFARSAAANFSIKFGWLRRCFMRAFRIAGLCSLGQ